MALDPAQSRADSIRLRSAFFISTAGDWIYRFAVPTLILEVTGSAVSTAFAYVLEYIPYIAVGLIAGVVADRWDRRRLMVICDSMSFGLALVIAGISLGHPSVIALYACAFLLACVRPF
jgi:MFS family permease